MSSVDNTPPRVLYLATTRLGSIHFLRLRVSEVASMTVVGPHLSRKFRITSHRTFGFRLPASLRRARLTLRDRGGNTIVRRLVW